MVCQIEQTCWCFFEMFQPVRVTRLNWLLTIAWCGVYQSFIGGCLVELTGVPKKGTLNKYCASFDLIRFQWSQCSMSNRENNNVLLIQPFQCEDPFYTSESDVYRRQILTYKDGPRNEIFKREGDVALWIERLTASPVMHASRFRTPLFPCGVFRETTLFLPSRCH